MEVNSSLDKFLANIIFKYACNGIEYNSHYKRFQLSVNHVSEQMFSVMAAEADSIGKKLKVDTINKLLSWIHKDAYYEVFLDIPLPMVLIINGEVLHIDVITNGRKFYIDLLRMSPTDFLIIKTDIEQLREKVFIPIKDNFVFSEEAQLYIPSFGMVIIKNLYLLKPLAYHHYTDWYFMPDLWRYKVADNIWEAYNLLSEITCGSSWNHFKKALEFMKYHGLSTFVFRMMLNALTNKRI